MTTGNSLVVLESSPPPRRPKRQARPFLVALALAVPTGIGAFVLMGRGVLSGSPAIGIGPVVFAEPWRATPFPIQIAPSTATWGASIRIDGLPDETSLSEGKVVKPGTWIVPLSRLATLKIEAPPTDAAKSRLSISLIAHDGEVLDQEWSLLAVMPAWHIGGAPPTVPTGPEGEGPSSWVGAGVEEEARSLVRKADEALADGSVQAARAIYRYAATQLRWPGAALALAATYDPHELARMGVLLPPDREKARFWYKRAQELTRARIAFYLRRLTVSP